jgi:hypothetical protein
MFSQVVARMRQPEVLRVNRLLCSTHSTTRTRISG